jgi:hypothetical protein
MNTTSTIGFDFVHARKRAMLQNAKGSLDSKTQKKAISADSNQVGNEGPRMHPMSSRLPRSNRGKAHLFPGEQPLGRSKLTHRAKGLCLAGRPYRQIFISFLGLRPLELLWNKILASEIQGTQTNRRKNENGNKKKGR